MSRIALFMRDNLSGRAENFSNFGRTENGALTYNSSLDRLVDAFYHTPATRADPSKGLDWWIKAYNEAPAISIALMFYIRDIRGGKGERVIFGHILEWLRVNDHEAFDRIVGLVPEYGCWKDIVKYPDETTVVQLVKDGIQSGDRLLAKWMPSENASSRETRNLARKWQRRLGMSSRDYRKALVALRQVVETQMSANEWGSINYEHVPSVANVRYNGAFLRHDTERRSDFLSNVKHGAQKINVSVLQPHDIVANYRMGRLDAGAAGVMWDKLENFAGDENGLVVADVSGSMNSYVSGSVTGRDVSIALAMYFSKWNTGPFHGTFMTFTDKPRIYNLSGNFKRDVDEVSSQPGYNTNIVAVFDELLKFAKRLNASQRDFPSRIYIVSDMEFDEYNRGNLWNSVILDEIDDKFHLAGYKMPQLVLWNVASRNNNTPALAMDRRVRLVSGVSTNTFRAVVQSGGEDSSNMVREILLGKRYEKVYQALGLD